MRITTISGWLSRCRGDAPTVALVNYTLGYFDLVRPIAVAHDPLVR